MNPTITLYPLSNYSFSTKPAQLEQDFSVNARLQRLFAKFRSSASRAPAAHLSPPNSQTDYEKYGLRRTVEGLLVVHEHGHPHVLLLQVANAFFKLPGDYLAPGEADVEGLKRRLALRLGKATEKKQDDAEGEGGMQIDVEDSEADEWEISDCLAQWWRPNYEGFMYPYVPAHISHPKEVKSMYFVQLPERKVLTVPQNMKLLAIPLFELYDNAVRYGPLLAAVPHLLSKYNFVLAS